MSDVINLGLSDAFASLARPERLAQRAYQAIRQAIRHGILVHGDLYSENDLSSRLGISRTPVREALIELAREGLVEIAPQRGFRLRKLSLEEQREIFDLRRVLESYVVERLAKNATPEGVAQLKQLLAGQADHIDDPSAFLAVDEQFHLLMPELVGLARTSDLLVTLRGAMWLMGSTALVLPHRAPDVLSEHQAIVDAIADHDPARAVRAVQAHIKRTSAAALEEAERYSATTTSEDSQSSHSRRSAVAGRSGNSTTNSSTPAAR